MEYDLIKELEKYTPKDEMEIEDKKKILEFLKTNENCYSRTNLKGHITAGAVIMHEDGDLLINFHKILKKWVFFGGHSDGETNTLNVAKREVAEESGITEYDDLGGKIFDAEVHLIPENKAKKEPEHYHYDIQFLFIVNKKDFKISNESINIKWVNIKEARQLLTDKDQIRMLNKASEIHKNSQINNSI